MNPLKKVLFLLLFPIGLLLAAAIPYYLHYESQREGLLSQLTKHQNNIEALQKLMKDRKSIDEHIEAYAQRTLGFDRETVDHRLREGLYALASDAGLTTDDIVANAKGTRAVKNPAVSARVKEFRSYGSSDFITMPDYIEIDGEVSGTGSFTAVVRILSLVQSQPWIWSVQNFSIKPKDSVGKMFDIRVVVSTIYMPDLAPAKPKGAATPDVPPRAPPIVDPPGEVVVATKAIIDRNIFSLPEPKPAPAASAVTIASTDPNPAPIIHVDPPPPPPPYHEWRLTGISTSPVQGHVAWIFNSRTKTAMLLQPGDEVLGAKLVKMTPEKVVFEIGSQRFYLVLNETLADRHAMGKTDSSGG